MPMTIFMISLVLCTTECFPETRVKGNTFALSKDGSRKHRKQIVIKIYNRHLKYKYFKTSKFELFIQSDLY